MHASSREGGSFSRHGSKLVLPWIVGVCAAGSLLLALLFGDSILSNWNSVGASKTDALPRSLQMAKATVDSPKEPRDRSSIQRDPDSAPSLREVPSGLPQAVEDQQALQGAKEDRHPLLAEIEGSLYGVLNPNEIVSKISSLLELEISDKAIPEPEPDGSMRFPIKGTPEGLTASLVVRAGSSAHYKDVVAVRVTLDKPFDPYLLDGAIRREPRIDVTCWSDYEGKVKAIGIQTQLGFSGESLRHGIDMPDEVTEGLYYRFMLDEGAQPLLSAYGFQNGGPADWKTDGVIQGGDLSAQDARVISGRILEAYQTLRRTPD